MNDVAINKPPVLLGPKLTKRNKKFCELYCDLTNIKTYGNASQSAIGAGYSPTSAGKTGFDLLKNPKIQAQLACIDAEIKAQSDFTREDYIRILRLNATTCNDTTKARYWEMIGRAKGFIEPEDNKSASISLFQQLDAKIGQRLQVLDTKDVTDIKQIDIVIDNNTNIPSTQSSPLPVNQ